jgi:hypothetical protein
MKKPSVKMFFKYKVLDARESRDSGVVWPVKEVIGRCGCGASELGNYVAFFVRQEDAQLFADLKNQLYEVREP